MRPLLFATLFSVSLLFAGSASAQVPPNTPLPGERDLIRDRQERLLEEQQRRLQEIQKLPGRDVIEPEPVLDDQRCFDIHTIILKGAALVSAEQQAALLQPYQGKCLGANQLNALLKAITQFYIDRGYVTSRAYLPQQDMADGELKCWLWRGISRGSICRLSPAIASWQWPFPAGPETWLICVSWSSWSIS